MDFDLKGIYFSYTLTRRLSEGAGSKTVFAILEKLMALCVRRIGPRGVKDVNQRIIYQLEASNVVSAGVKAHPESRGQSLAMTRHWVFLTGHLGLDSQQKCA